jgi:hypothetical protein
MSENRILKISPSQTPAKQLQQHLYLQNMLSAVSQAAQDLKAFSPSNRNSDQRFKTLSLSPHFFLEAFSSAWMNICTRITALLYQQDSTNPEILEADSPNSGHPEHLPPTSTFQVLGDYLRAILRPLTSESSKFGFRVVFATMSIGILGFLQQTQRFFVTYRLVWAMVMIPISMSPTSGNAIYGFLGRVLGTAFAMGMAEINWYIVDGKRAGVIVFFFMSMMAYYYFLLRYPRFIVIFILAAVNHVLIIGQLNLPRYTLLYDLLTQQTQDTSFRLESMASKRLQSQVRGILLCTL